MGKGTRPPTRTNPNINPANSYDLERGHLGGGKVEIEGGSQKSSPAESTGTAVNPVNTPSRPSSLCQHSSPLSITYLV